MASASNIKAGGAYVEVTVRDKYTAALKQAAAKFAAFGTMVKVQSLGMAAVMKSVGQTMTGVGAAVTGLGTAVLAPMLKSVQTFMEVSKHAQKIGVAISAIDANKAKALDTAWSGFKATLGTIQYLVGSALAGPLTSLLKIVAGVGIHIARFVRDNQQLVVTIAAVAAGVVVAGGALIGLGVTFGIIGAAIAGITAVLAGIGTLFAAIVSPIGLITVGIIGAVAAFIYFNKTAQQAIGGVFNALISGNWQLAGQIIGAALSVGFESVKIAAMQAWFGVKESATEAFTAISNTAQETVAFIGTLFSEVLTQFRSNWKVLENVAVGVWQAIENAGMLAIMTLADASTAFFALFGKAAMNAFEIAVKIAPELAGVANAAALDGAKLLTGIDIRGAIAKANEERLKTRGELGDKAADDRYARLVEHGGELAKALEEFGASRAELDKLLGEALKGRNDLFNKIKIPGLNFPDGQGQGLSSASVLGSSAGTFSGRAAALMGIGTGGGQAVHDDKAHEKMNEQIRILRDLFKEVAGKPGLAFS